jgi:hypothetical protein
MNFLPFPVYAYFTYLSSMIANLKSKRSLNVLEFHSKILAS